MGAVVATDPASACAVASSSRRHTSRGKCSGWAGAWTLFQQKDTRRGALHPAIQTIGKELVKYRPHRPREANRRRKTSKPRRSEAVDAVDIYKLRSIGSSPRVIAEYASDRKKCLQISVSKAMRAMRSIFCRTLRQKVVLLGALDLLTSTMSLQSCLECRSSHCAGPRRPEDLTTEAVAQFGLYAHRDQDRSKAC
jgi:hypothetical protein